ncbi:MAG TPA: hypothetical protein VK709_05010 [Candidatus Saccharimonadales bacterium]|jgi:hypothetical protein|nr:hypothetical protein [Candidatus Saccharimonadales bacterium]
MKAWKLSKIFGVTMLLCASSALAQDQRQSVPPIDPNAPLQPLDTTVGGSDRPVSNRPPLAAARGVDASSDNSEAYDPSQVTPDPNTLAGAAPFTLGSLQHKVNTFDPGISVSQVGQFVPGTAGKTISVGETIATGSLNFSRTWSEYHFSTLYTGGETFNEGYASAAAFFGTTSPHFQFHNLVVSQQADWARWHILLMDNFTASPGAAFSGQGTGGPGLAGEFSSMLGASLNSLSQSFLPSENINTSLAMRLRNSVLAQAQYALSRRSAITLAASYGFLHFDIPGFQNSQMINVQGGYDYLLDPSDSLAILASYGKIDYTGTGRTTSEYGGALAFGRKITGRLAFQVAAGPQEIRMVVPGGSGNFNLLYITVNSALTYQRRRSAISLNFVRGLNSGSGIFLGATSDTLSGAANYQFSRNWVGSITAGSSLNYNLAPAGVTRTQFYNWFAGANLARQLGQHAGINLSYGAVEQNNPIGCTLAICGGTGLQQTVGLSINWHLLPVGKEGR